MDRIIVGVIDNRAKDLIPQTVLWLHRHPATAIRMYTDLASDPKSPIHLHVEDYDLVQLGTIDDDFNLKAGYERLITGKHYAAMLAEPTTDNTTRPMGAPK